MCRLDFHNTNRAPSGVAVRSVRLIHISRSRRKAYVWPSPAKNEDLNKCTFDRRDASGGFLSGPARLLGVVARISQKQQNDATILSVIPTSVRHRIHPLLEDRSL